MISKKAAVACVGLFTLWACSGSGSGGGFEVSSTNSTVTATPQTNVVANGTEAAAVTVRVLDSLGRPIAGKAVDLTANGDGWKFTPQLVLTDAGGRATGMITCTKAETKTITAIVDPGSQQVVLATKPTVIFIGDAGSVSSLMSTVTVSPSGSVIADGVARVTVTVTVRDDNGNPVAGQSVQLVVSGALNSIIQPGLTNVEGVASGTVAATKAEIKTITATIGPSNLAIVQRPTVTFVSDSSTIHVTNTTVTAAPGTGVIANGTASSTITVTVKDRFGNVVPGQVVQLAATGTINTLVQPAAVTDANGVATGTLTSTKAETKTITATVNPSGTPVVANTQPTIVFVGDPGRVSATNSTVVAVPNTNVVANGAATSTITVTVRDVNNNTLAAQLVSLSSTGFSNSLTQPAATDGNGVTTGTIASIRAETKTITAIVNPGANQVVVTTQPTVVFIGDASNLSASLSTASSWPVTAVVANGTATSTVTVTIKDINGNAVAGQTVQLAADGTSNSITQPAGLTNASGVATGTIATTKAETKTIVVTANPGGSQVILLQKPTIAFIGDSAGISASLSTATAAPTANVVANGSNSSIITVTVRDSNGNPVGGQAVQLAATGTSNTLTQPGSVTDANGVATGSIASTRAETKTLTVTVNPGGGAVVVAQQPTVGFIGDASTINAGNSSAAAAPSSGIIANGSDTSTITVTVRDVNSNVIPGQVVQLSSTGTNQTLTQPGAVTNSSGVASGTIASTKAETKTITATVNPGGGAVVVTQQPTADFDGDPNNPSAGLSSAVASPTNNVVANGTATSTITVTVVDGNGNPLAGKTVQLAASGSNNTVTQPAAVTNASGVATGSIASTTAETKTITITVDPGGTPVVLSTQPTVGFIGDAGNLSAGNSAAVASPSSNVVANGTATATITVTVRDVNNNPVAGQTVGLASTGSNNTITQPAAVTDASGIATGSIASVTAETKTLTVTINPGGTPVIVTQQPTVGFIGDAGNISAGSSTAAASPTSGVAANGTATATITVTVRDGNNNAVPGQTVQLAASGTSNSITQPASVTNASGVATGTVASTKAETKTLTITVNPGGSPVVVTQQPTVGFIGDASSISAGNSTAIASATSNVVANGTTTSTVTVTVRDANNNPVAGQTVQLASTGSNNTITQPAGVTNASGVATGTIASTRAETKTVTGTVNPGGTPVVVTQQPTIGFIGDASTINAGNSSVVAAPSSNIVANGAATSLVTVTVRDANNNVVPGQTVQLAATGTNNTISQAGAVTDSGGVASGAIASTRAETKTVTATVNPGGTPVVVTQQASVGFIADSSQVSASLSTAVASPSSGVLANGATTSTITVTVLDANSNPVAGQVVQLSSSGFSNSITQPSVTNASGVATGTIASIKAETKTITVTVNPGAGQTVLTQQPTVAFVADSSQLSGGLSTASASPATDVTANGTATSTITITVRDQNNNPVAGQTVQLAATGSGNTISQPASTTDASGLATGTLASTTVETKTITATVNPGGTPVVLVQQPTVSFTSLMGPDDFRLGYGKAGTSAVLARIWDDSASSWSAEASTATTSATIQWVVNKTINQGWYGSGWSKRKKLTILSSQVAGSADLQNFPVLFWVVDSDLGSVAQADGDDILFTAGNGTTKLNHEIESWVTGTGELVAWVKIPRLSATANTDIYVYYGNGSASDQQSATRVWSNAFAAVWHLQGAYNGTTDEVKDSSSGSNDGAAGTAPTRIAGKIGLGQDFESGNSEYLTVNHGGKLDFAGSSDQLTFSAWLRAESASAWLAVLGKGATSEQRFGCNNGNPARGFLQLGSDTLTTTGSISTGTWVHLVSTWDHSTMRVYINGSVDATTTSKSTTLGDTTDTTMIGGAGASGLTDNFDGVIDEMRISSTARSADWIATEYANQNTPGSFFFVGAEEASATSVQEEVLVALADTGSGTDLSGMKSTGSGWTVGWTVTDIVQANAGKRGFDLAYEDVTGNAMVVYSDNTATPVYRTLSGGVWSAAQSLPLNDGGGANPDPNTGVVLWVELAARPACNEIALAYVDQNDDLVALLWDGTQWVTGPATSALETTVTTNASSNEVDNRAFDLCYEQCSGRLMVVWAQEGATGFRYTSLQPGTTTWAATASVTSAPAGGTVHYLDLAPEPGGDRIAGGFFDAGDTTERLGLSTWDGSAWVNSGEYDSQMRDVNDTATGDFHGAVGWVGSTGVAVCVYPDNQTGTLDWARWTSAGGWVVQTDVTMVGKGYTESTYIVPLVGQGELMLGLSDSNSDLYVLTYDGSAWTVTNGGAALQTLLSTIAAVPFFLDVKRH